MPAPRAEGAEEETDPVQELLKNGTLQREAVDREIAALEAHGYEVEEVGPVAPPATP